MHRPCKRAVAVFLLTLALALPIAALPEAGPPPDRTVSLLGAVWEHVASWLATFGLSRSSMDPNGTPRSADSSTDLSGGSVDSDSRSTMDPNGGW